MSNFRIFSDAVSGRVKQLQANAKEFFVVDIPDLFDIYLKAFPEGTNPIFRERTEHDCVTCKHFIRNLGKVVTIDSGTVNTVWDVDDLPYPYDVVASTLSDVIKKAPIISVFRTPFTSYGYEKNPDNHDTSITWSHFHGKTPKNCVTNNHATQKSRINSLVQVFQRGLDEIRLNDLDEVLELIEQNSIYRGKEFKDGIANFKDLKLLYEKQGKPTTFVWENCHNPAAGLRNTVIGTLFTDLASGDDIDAALKKFESKVAPANYKRPTALITPRMIDSAVEQLRSLDLEDSIHRRLATLEDLSINDVLFVDNSVASKMKDTLTDLLNSSSSVKKTRKPPKETTKISIQDFISLGSKSIELILENNHLNRFVTLTAPVHQGVKNLFKWGNNFAWSYDGGVADSMRELVVSRGGRVDGVFRFTHQWNYAKRNASLMDLHVFMPTTTLEHRDGCHDSYPSHRRVGWNKRNDPSSGGIQDVDYTSEAPAGYVPVENITFPDLSRMPEGKYVCKIHNWKSRSPNEGGFKAEIEFGNQVYEYEVDRPLKNKEWVTVAEVTLRRGEFSIEHKLPTTASSKKKWGVDTLVPVPVESILLSPNHWENSGKVGNKHWFFILKGCRVDEPVRGFYNEFLSGSLEPHRKVFEVLGAQTKCQPAEKQLSGVGFSETVPTSVKVIADGRPYEIQF
jgi:hypothetical protein